MTDFTHLGNPFSGPDGTLADQLGDLVGNLLIEKRLPNAFRDHEDSVGKVAGQMKDTIPTNRGSTVDHTLQLFRSQTHSSASVITVSSAPARNGFVGSAAEL
jgi:hypothetical protein